MSWSELRGIMLVMLGLLTLIYYFSWWFQDGRILSPLIVLWFVGALVYSIPQILGTWAIYLATHRRRKRSIGSIRSIRDSSVDVFVTSCGEPFALVERALRSACQIRGDHRTWLLDDGHDPRLAVLAAELGAGYLTREGRQDAKAGNVNAALARTEGKIIAILDVDHTARANFLEDMIPLFAEADVGFVQPMLTFENWEDGLIAQMASESTLDFYNPTSIGADGLGSATLLGSGALIRRDALTSIGDYQPGLAEDLATSINLHAAGWHSIYVPEPLAPGMAPSNLASWFTQQLKWSRGVFEVLITTFPYLFRKLNVGQRISYAVRMTYYWVGMAIAFHLLLGIIVLWSNNLYYVELFADYLQHLLPLLAMTIIIRQLALRRWRHPTTHLTKLPTQLQAYILVAATWPVYTLAWLLAVCRIPLAYSPTYRLPGDLLHPIWILANLAAVTLLGLGLLRFLAFVEDPLSYWLFLAFLVVMLATQLLHPIWWLVEFVGKQYGSRREPVR